jgi:YD repeat-containing protein
LRDDTPRRAIVRTTTICVLILSGYMAAVPAPAAAETTAWRGFLGSSFRSRDVCGGRVLTDGLYATPREAAAAVCEQQSCDAYEIRDLQVSADGRAAFFWCEVNILPGQPIGAYWGGTSVFLVTTAGPKSAGPCSGTANGGQPCQGQQGNPIRVATGNKFHVETDYTGAGEHPLRFAHYYNSSRGAMGGSRMGQRRRHTYERSVTMPSPAAGPIATVTRHDGSAFSFTLTGGEWKGDSDVPGRLLALQDAAGNATGWQYVDTNDELESYDVSGRLLSIENRSGLRHTLSYDGEGRLAVVTDSFGRTLQFSYDAAGHVASLNVAGASYSYTYDKAANLTAVTYPDGTRKTFHYEVAGYPLLTGITDENGVRYSTYSYDMANGERAVQSELNGGVNRTTVQTTGSGGVVYVSDALGKLRTFTHINDRGVLKHNGVDAPCTSCEARTFGYDSNGFVSSKTDFNGNRTDYVRDGRGLEVKRIEGLTPAGGVTPVTRTITTEWHPVYRLPTRIAEPFRLTTLTYGPPGDAAPGNRGSLLTKTLQATADANGSLGFGASATGLSRTWTYTYNANGQPLTVDGPRVDVSDVTRYTYYANDATCAGPSPIGCRGQTASIVNAAGHVTTLDEYNAAGQPVRMTDPNGVVTTLSYDARLRLTGRNVGGELTTYGYDAAGQLTQVTMPDGSALFYSYDGAHRLTRIQDSQGNRIAYTLDAMGNRTREDVLDPAETLAQTRARLYDSLSRLYQEIGAQAQTTTYAYDNQGNVVSVDGPLAGAADVRANGYDALNRLVRVTDPYGGQVSYGYDARDRLVSVSDPRTLTTRYAYDGLNNLYQLVSPDTGTTSNTYDEAGNVITATDAKGQQSRYTYDGLNRVTTVDYLRPGGATTTHTYAYDTGVNQKGRLTQLAEPGSTTLYSYDQKGRITSEVRTINGIAYTTAYSYDAHGRLAGVAYPGGRVLGYTFDALGRIGGITSQKGGEMQVIVSNVLYRPFGGPKSYTFGNGQTYTRGFDTDGRITSYTLGTQTIAVQYDIASRITSLADGSRISAYGYDALDRLTSFAGSNTSQSFSYDAIGNRATKTAGIGTASYSYAAASNRLAAIMGSAPRSYTHDAVGSVAADGVNTFAYDARGRMAQVANAAGVTDYGVNALGQRIRKTNAQGDTVYHYDTQGRLIAESTAAGAIQKEYVYLGEVPVAVIQ